jgi:protease IV
MDAPQLDLKAPQADPPTPTRPDAPHGRSRLGPEPLDAAAAGAQVAYGVAQAARLAANLARRRAPMPDYVTFVLDGPYPDLAPPRKPWQRLVKTADDSLPALRAQLRTVGDDPRVKGVVLHLRSLEMPLATLEALRAEITRLRGAGKRVVAWSTRYTTASYLVACTADEVLLQPGGEIAPLGIAQSYLFLADALARADLKFEAVQISPYKSAADALTRTSMSDEMREMVTWLLDAQYAEVVRAVAEGRHLDEDGARALVDAAPYTDVAALASGVIDGIVGEEDLVGHLGSADEAARLETWAQVHRRLFIPAPPRPGKYVALLRIEGNIVDGKSAHPPMRPPVGLPLVTDTRAGDLSVVQDARKVLADKQAAAVVVYIDSRGGSATASEAMAAALAKVAAHKPLVAAMGPVAGSGGYYVATPARWIVAAPGTITGSIGVLFGKMVSSGLFERLGIHPEILSRGRNVRMWSGEAPFDVEELARVHESIERSYTVFLDRVAAARGMTREAVDAIGGGRVWTGRQALERGLVDELGSLETALAKAREMAGLSPRAPVVEVTSAKVPLAPGLDPAATFRYISESVRLFNRARLHYLMPLIWRDEV